MHRQLTVIACAAAMLSCGYSQAQTAPAPAPARKPAPVFPLAPPPAYVPPATPQGSGPFPAIMEADAGLPTHTVYRPASLAALGQQKLPVVAFGNGACINVGNRFRYFLTEIASHGFIAIATGPIGPKEAEFTTNTASLRGSPAAGSPGALALQRGENSDSHTPPADTTAAQLLDAVTWAIAENSRAGSRYYGRIDVSKVAVMGQSCGGVQAIAAGRDPRVTTVGVWNSGAFPVKGRGWTIAAAQADKEDLKYLHGSAIYISGEPSDVAFDNANEDFRLIEGMPVFRGWREQTGHPGTYREPDGGEFGKVASAWLMWQLKGDQAASGMFVGADCQLCRKSNWHVQTKNFPALNRDSK